MAAHALVQMWRPLYASPRYVRNVHGGDHLSRRTIPAGGSIAEIVEAPPRPGVERVRGFFRNFDFDAHRHASFVVGLATAGVQRLRWRGSERIIAPGQCWLLAPDELHDGRPLDERGFGFRAAYLDPLLLQEAFEGADLDAWNNELLLHVDETRRRELAALWHFDAENDDAELTCALASLADMLRPRARSLPFPALIRAREHIAAAPQRPLSLSDLEAVAGLDRWSLARAFRSAFGVSPSRYRTMRQLERARDFIRKGASLADAAHAAGFADQSHMSRKFVSAFGVTPARWRAARRQSQPITTVQ